MTVFGLLLRKFPLHAFGLDELGGVNRGEVAEFLTLGTKVRCTGASITGIASRIDAAHPVLVSARVLGPEFARQKRQVLIAVTLTRCNSFGTGGLDCLVAVSHAGIALCCLLGDVCGPFG